MNMDEASSGIRWQQSFVANHLQAIDYFEHIVQDIENNHDEKDWNDLSGKTKIQYTTLTTSVVIRSVAFLEATANEMVRRIVEDKSDLNTGYEIHPSLRSAINASTARELIEKRKSTLKKFDRILDGCGEDPISRGEGIGQQTQTVIGLRNHLIHYEPEMLSPDELPKQTTSMPKEVKWSNPFENERMASLDRCLSSTMVEWAANTCFNYAEEFFDRLDIENDISGNAQPLEEFYIDENPARPYIAVLESLRHQYR